RMLLWVVRCSHALLCAPPRGMACLLVSWESKSRANSPRKKVIGRESGSQMLHSPTLGWDILSIRGNQNVPIVGGGLRMVISQSLRLAGYGRVGHRRRFGCGSG